MTTASGGALTEPAGEATLDAEPALGPTPAAARPAPATAHILALDGLRGVAAISVMLHHAWVGNSHGWLAVDFFFCLSGFVIAQAYERKLAGGLTVGRYMAGRLQRIYPMLLLGGLIGLATWRGSEDATFLGAAPGWTFALVFAANCLFVPYVAQPRAFPFNNSQWSIVYELLANAVHAVLLPVLTNRVVLAICAASALVLTIATVHHGTMNWGHSRDHAEIALARTGFSFFAGVLLFRHGERLRACLPAVPFWVLAAVILVIASVPALHQPWPWLNACRELATALAINPALVALGLTCPAGGRIVRWLGVVSFPLYAVHAPLVFLAMTAMQPLYSGLLLKLVMLGWCVPILGLALLLGLYVDLPLNRLRRRPAG